MYLKKGDKAPSFKILNQNNAMISLSDFKNQKILLWFFPKANTPG
jgi:peroxiredoxin Q/BCP